jgi:hypothetical protein
MERVYQELTSVAAVIGASCELNGSSLSVVTSTAQRTICAVARTATLPVFSLNILTVQPLM